MDTRKLKYFLAVVDHDGFNRAAEHLLIAQPSLSQTIAGLEKDLGVPLFHRIGRRAVLSEAGKELVGPARLVMRDLDAAQSAVQALRGVRSGRLDIITMPSPGIEPLTSMIAAFSEVHPSVRLNVGAAFTPEEVIESVRTGSSEIGLAGSSTPIRVPGVQVLDLERQPLILIVNPKADPFSPGVAIQREDLGGHRLIASQRGSLMRWLVDDALAHGVNTEIVVEVAHRTSILPLVLAGVGHAVMPSSWAPTAHKAGLRTLLIEPVSYLNVAILSRKDGLTPAATAFLDVAELYVASGNESASLPRDL
ncbi:DNA-binding transcriptional LysR family regulator [Arthrobacter sp. V4I6]|uniref:LysR family transcriptional regulator n=1 Tax=unclassified Arthrobacter TaxID=235627 RepID=UPI00277ED7EA|nr:MULTISPECIES: LysR family transcriptional regulator [unclassified Arthrobacter]MDQ0821336.1 DNA-binding transcriptional LysR family regulator [Arthrobacter sp. V1I7]MDQ0855600.1 DNA-binding transcriptional LysR family regulator [Arthrobacter sp. V4I6]